MRISYSGNYVARGQGKENIGPEEINLFTGAYTKGFRVIDFRCSSESKTAVGEVCSVLTTTSTGVPSNSADTWDWSNQEQIGWASGNTGVGTSSKEDQFSLVDSSVVVVDKLYVFSHHAAGDFYHVNYYIELEPVDLKSYEYALAYMQNGRVDDV